tara:strand:+ start:61827 stop:62024 length:198 start_codon:yes stop_codon:yes gene_type:complete
MKKTTVEKSYNWCCCTSNYGWAIFLIILGGYFILKDFGIIPSRISIWPILLVAFGIYLLIKNSKK